MEVDILVIPAALLRRFYVDGSLLNTEGGFEFQLKNRVAPTTIVSLGPVEIDGEPHAADDVTITASRLRIASQVDSQSPLFLAMGRKVTINVKSDNKLNGKHELLVHALTKEVGAVVIGVTACL